MAGDLKKYVVTFYVQQKGTKAFLSSMKRMESQVKKMTISTKKGEKATKGFGSAILKAGARALYTIPLWLLLRSAIMGVIRTVSDAVKAYMDFEEELARIKTVVTASSATITEDMILIKAHILDTATKSRIALKELAEGFYFLRTANLSTAEAMSAFTPAVDLATATGNKLAETSRSIAVIYNTIGNRIGQNLTLTEKMTKIGDVLAFTYATQEVQLKELISGYIKLAPYVSGLSDSFTTLTTILGVLNTRGLKAGRTGRLLARSFIQIIKNADKLKSVFDITFDEDKPLNVLNLFKDMASKLKQNTDLTMKQQRSLHEVFATRGRVAPQLILSDFTGMIEAIENANEKADGFAKKMAEIRMATPTAQLAELKNIINTLAIDFINGAFDTRDFTKALKDLNKTLREMRDDFTGMGRNIAFAGSKLGTFIEVYTKLKEAMEGQEPMFEKSPWWLPTGIIKLPRWDVIVERGLGLTGNVIEDVKDALKELETEGTFKRLNETQEEFNKRTKEGLDERIKAENEVNKTLTSRKIDEWISQKQSEIRLGDLNEEKQKLSHILNISKSIGMSEVALAKIQLGYLKDLQTRNLLVGEKGRLKILNAENKVLEAQTKHLFNQTKTVESLILSLGKGVVAQQQRIKKSLEAFRMKPFELAKAIEAGGMEAEAILSVYDKLSKAQKEAILIAIGRQYDAMKEVRKVLEFKEPIIMPKEGIDDFASYYDRRMKTVLNGLFGRGGYMSQLTGVSITPITPKPAGTDVNKAVKEFVISQTEEVNKEYQENLIRVEQEILTEMRKMGKGMTESNIKEDLQNKQLIDLNKNIVG